MRRGKLLATIAFIGAVLGGIVLSTAPAESVVAGGQASSVSTGLNRGW